MPTIDISSEDLALVRGILARLLPDRDVRVFGSRAMGTAAEFSDLDLLVMGDEPLDVAVKAELRECFAKSGLPFKVDVVEWAACSPAFRRTIERMAIPIPPAQPGSKE